MKIRQLTINNFRGIKSGRLTFTDHSVLIGPNNVGKTTIIEALALLLGRDRLVREMSEHDFYGGDPQVTDRIRVVVTLDQFPNNDIKFSPQWFGPGRGTDKWLDPNTGELHPVEADDRVLCVQIAADARFDRNSLDVEVVRYFYDDDDTRDPFDDESVNTLPSSLVREIGFFLDPAYRTWDRTISFSSDLFRQVVQYAAGKPSEAVIAERDHLRNPTRPLEDDNGLASLVGAINNELARYFSRSTSLKLRLTTTDSAGVLTSIYPHYRGDHGFVVPARREGSGLVSLQKLALLMQFGHVRVKRGDNFVMAIEEPELHIPPPLQRRLLHSMEAITSQAIITTHSPAIAASCRPTDLLIVRQLGGTLTATPLLDRPLDKNDSNPVRSLVSGDRQALVDALMHDNVLVPEGKEDYLWLLRITRMVETSSTTDHAALDFPVHVGTIPTPSSRVIDTYKFISARHPATVCLVDGDPAGNAYARELLALPSPPAKIIQLNTGCEIEDVVLWIVAADAAALRDPVLANHAVPATIADLREELKVKEGKARLKNDHQAHDALADALSVSHPCVLRAAELLSELAHVICGKTGPTRLLARDPERSTPQTTLWRLILP